MLFDLLKVRKLVDDAVDLTVRAQNGTASSAINNESGFPGAALGFNTRGGSNAKLSSERKFRMRELATQKLSQAYRLDEIAASVATMQSASALDAVANLVLQRTPSSADARYVHFFHERIPSRMLAEYTTLDVLNDIIAHEPGHAAPLRTRAFTKIFKEDILGATQDLSEALNICRINHNKHGDGEHHLISMKQAREEAERRRAWSRDWIQDHRVADDDQPQGIELQLLFQRGNQYLTMAGQNIKSALESFASLAKSRGAAGDASDIYQNPSDSLGRLSEAEQKIFHCGLEARDSVRKYAKRALRDYTAFASQLDYAFAAATDAQSNVFEQNDLMNGGRVLPESRQLEDGYASTNSGTEGPSGEQSPNLHQETSAAAVQTFPIADILSSSPPASLPPTTPASSAQLISHPGNGVQPEPTSQYHEMITYHPLLPETLHSLLLAHTLLQTPPTTISRIASNVARLARLADGYPFFLSARSPSRADWCEVLRRTQNWIGLSTTWDSMCQAGNQQNAPAGSSGSSGQSTGQLVKHKTGAEGNQTTSTESKESLKQKIHKDAVLDALADDRVVDDVTFQKAVAARESRALRDMKEPVAGQVSVSQLKDEAPGQSSSKNEDTTPIRDSERQACGKPGHSPATKDEDYMIGTERAAAISRWVLEAPTVVGQLHGSKPRRRKRPTKKPASDGRRLEESIESLELHGPD